MLCPSCGTTNEADRVECVSCHESLTLHGQRKRKLETAATQAGDSSPESLDTLAMSASGGGGLGPNHILASAGDHLAGRYKLNDILGKGGMGVVYHADDLHLKEEIAIKLLRAEYSESEADVERFKREIKTSRRISHDNVIRIHDFGMAGDVLFISMELLTGGTLYDRVKKGPLEIQDGLDMAIAVADGLDAAHRKGVIHRDIKPHNVLFGDDGAIKLVDFGIARLSTSTSQTVGVTGTPHYMSPEQAEGDEITEHSDVYSFGVMLYEMFTGELPFKANSLVRLAVMHSQEDAPRPRLVRSEIPPDLETIILRCMQKRRADRFQTARELGVALRAVRAGKRLEGGGLPEAASAPPRERTRRSRTGLILAICAVVVLVAAVGVLWRWNNTRLLAEKETPTLAPSVTASTTPAAGPTSIVPAQELPVAIAFDSSDKKTHDRLKTTVRIDRKRKCLTPCEMKLMPGKYRVAWEATGYEPIYRDLFVDPESPRTERAEMVRAKRRSVRTPTPHRATRTPSPTRTPKPTVAPVAGNGTLRVIPRPWADLYLDGRKLKTIAGGSFEGEVPAGQHTLRFKFKGQTYERDFEYRFTIRKDERITLSVDMLSKSVTKL